MSGCSICNNIYGGQCIPTLLTCCGGDVCFTCAENWRSAQIAELPRNRKKIKCMMCNQLFHCKNETPWIVNRPFINSHSIDVDMSVVREAQSAMQTPAPAAITLEINTSTRHRRQQETEQDNNGGGDGEDSTAAAVSHSNSSACGDGVRQLSSISTLRRSQRRSRTQREDSTMDANIGSHAIHPGESSATTEVGSTRASKRIRRTHIAASQNDIAESDEIVESDFAEHAFMNNSLFHLNPFIEGKKKINKGFGPFLQQGIATCGCQKLPSSIIGDVEDLTYEQIRDKLGQEKGWDTDDPNGYSKFGSQAAMWLKNVSIGSFVIMRHHYPKCQYCPQRLFKNGKYIGPVYVIGVVKKKVAPGSIEEKTVAAGVSKTSSCEQKWLNNFYMVDWQQMGITSKLSASTRSYLFSICQPTVACICSKPGRKSSGATSESVKRDLWKNANISICSDDFDDDFKL